MDVFLHSSPFQISDPSMVWYESHHRTAHVILNSHFISTRVCVCKYLFVRYVSEYYKSTERDK